MNKLIHVLTVFISLLCLLSCSDTAKNIEVTKLLAQKMNAGDTVGIRQIFADSVQNYFASSLTNTFSVDTEINNILTSEIYDGFYFIDQILESNGSFVRFTTKEFPGYLMYSNTETDTLNYLMTYYFKHGKIYKTRTDSLDNIAYCYSCIDREYSSSLTEFFTWLRAHHTEADSSLYIYYDHINQGIPQSPDVVIKNEELQKMYFKIWKKGKESP